MSWPLASTKLFFTPWKEYFIGLVNCQCSSVSSKSIHFQVCTEIFISWIKINWCGYNPSMFLRKHVHRFCVGSRGWRVSVDLCKVINNSISCKVIWFYFAIVFDTVAFTLSAWTFQCSYTKVLSSLFVCGPYSSFLWTWCWWLCSWKDVQ